MGSVGRSVRGVRGWRLGEERCWVRPGAVAHLVNVPQEGDRDQYHYGLDISAIRHDKNMHNIPIPMAMAVTALVDMWPLSPTARMVETMDAAKDGSMKVNKKQARNWLPMFIDTMV